MNIEVRIYEDGNDNRGTLIGSFGSERAAKKAAVKALGHASLRGAATWPASAGAVYQFGKHADTDANPRAELTYE